MSIFAQSNRLFGTVAPQLRREGQEFKLGAGITLPHFSVRDTALAACLATIGVPFRDPAPFTDDVALDSNGNETSRTTLWWLGDASGPDQHGKAHKTEELLGAWIERERFEKEHPFHPFVSMRAAIDARGFWVPILQAWKTGRAIFPVEMPRGTAYYATRSINAACVLKALGYKPLAFNDSTFFLEQFKDGVAAEHIVLTSAFAEGASPQQWMSRVLFNYSHLVNIAKSQSVIVRQTFDDRTLLLAADAKSKTVDRFHSLL